VDFETARGRCVGLWFPNSLAAPRVGDSLRVLSKGRAEAVCWCHKGYFVGGMPLLWDQRGLTWGSGGPRTNRVGPRTASASFLSSRARRRTHARQQSPAFGRTCTTPEPAGTTAPEGRTVVSKRVFAQCVRAGHSVSLRASEGDGFGAGVGGGSAPECRNNRAWERGAAGRVDEANERPSGGMRLAAFENRVVAAPPSDGQADDANTLETALESRTCVRACVVSSGQTRRRSMGRARWARGCVRGREFSVWVRLSRAGSGRRSGRLSQRRNGDVSGSTTRPRHAYRW
jgi:hypothetical protein